MNIFVLLPLTAVFVNLAMASFVVGFNWQNPLNRAFTYLSLMLLAWAVTDALLWSLEDRDNLYIIVRIQSMVYTQSGAVILNVLYRYIGRKHDLVFRYTLALGLLLALCGVMTPWVVQDVRIAPWGGTMVPGPLYFPGAVLSAILPCSFGVYLVVSHYRGVTAMYERARIRIIIYGSVTALAFAWIFNLFIPFFTGIEFPQQTHIAGIIMQLFLFYAILKYRLFTIDVPSVARELFLNAPEGVVVLQNSRVEQMNNPARSMIQPFVVNSAEETVLEFSTLCAQSGWNQQEIIKVSDDNLYALSLSATSVKEHEEDGGVLMFIRDISERIKNERQIWEINDRLKQARDQAIEANMAKSQFFASMSHELRTPLSAILGFSLLAHDRAATLGDNELVGDIETIRGAGNHLLELINGVLDLSKIEAGKYVLYLDSFNLKAVIEEVANMVKPLVQQNQNQLRIDIDNDVFNIYSDETKVRQILFNLLSNAGKFTEGGVITLACKKSLADVAVYEIRVSDTGIGMSEEFMSMLFGAYQQGGAVSAQKYGGTGLGLMITQRLCRLLGGDITVESIPGRGSSFMVLLPVKSLAVQDMDDQ